MRRAAFVACAAALLLVACSPLTPRRLEKADGQWKVRKIATAPLPDASLLPKRRSAEAKELSSLSWEHFDSFDVGIVEFRENGSVWSAEQRDLVLNKVNEVAKTQGATVVVFVHGWHHSARWNDTNLVDFRRVLYALATQPQVGMGCDGPYEKRSRVIGVYVGWRGESIPVPGINYFTIWSRKKVAQKIGGAATDHENKLAKYRNTDFSELLVKLDKIRDDANRTAMPKGRPFTTLAITGHSLGGAMILSAMQRIVFNATIDQAKVLPVDKLNRVGDLVVLLNPAVEARRYKIFRAQAKQSDFPPTQKPIMVTLSSRGDWPNRIALRVARFFTTVVTPTRWKEWRDSTTALGFSRYDLTHSIEAPEDMLNANIDGAKFNLWEFGEMKAKDIQLARSRKIGQIVLNNDWKVNDAVPFFVAKSNKALIPNHSKIFTPGVVSLVGPLVIASGQKNVDTFCRGEIIAETDTP
jgi:hypothetical protein